ncbi:centrosomal protein of 70 kDa isoform X5 [Trichechus manatus latirostris]|uniref:Centrosomal protein of 70 kDa n=1 Tax=Trichechus manatus latirostris TaxID=127582 RepID=A0A2Y9RE94_TRIMA|nr:centrosomal protein of 70 kDa isoform X5 [Trichechus manatus latirostris]
MSPEASKAYESSESSDRFMTEKQQEEAEWESINVLLMTHGLKALSLVGRTDLKDLIIFDKQSSQRMRENFKTLVEDTARQQNMIRELIETNQQLKNELQLEQRRAADQEQRANDLEQIMESVKSKIGELEDESLNRVCQQQTKIKNLQKEHTALQAKCQRYEKKQMEQQETIASLQKNICRLTQEEEERIVTQNRVFAYLCKRVPHSVLDRQLLCLIDYYESKIRKIHQQRPCKEGKSQSEEEKDCISLDASPSYKGLLMSLQNQLQESKARIDVLLSEKLNLQKDLETRAAMTKYHKAGGFKEQKYIVSQFWRPTQHELRLYKQQVKNLEKALKKNIKLQELISQKKAEDPEKKGEESSKDNQQQALIDHRYFQDLYKSLKILSAELVPWHNLKKQDENESIKVEDLLFIVDTMLEEVENKNKDNNVPNFQTLQAVVSHFQKLFDVPSLNGVYPRMNEVYTRLGEMTNAVRNLQELLELDSSTSLYVLVSTVGKLCRLIIDGVNEQVKQLLGPEELQSIINKLEEHEEFFPAFQAFTNDLLEILEIDDVDAIVPASSLAASPSSALYWQSLTSSQLAKKTSLQWLQHHKAGQRRGDLEPRGNELVTDSHT